MDLLCKLPLEVTEHILEFLDLCSLSRAARVSSRWQELIDNYSKVWQKVCYEFCTDRDIARDRYSGYTWKVYM